MQQKRKRNTKEGRENKSCSICRQEQVQFSFGARDKVEHGETATIKGATGGRGKKGVAEGGRCHTGCWLPAGAGSAEVTAKEWRKIKIEEKQLKFMAKNVKNKAQANKS